MQEHDHMHDHDHDHDHGATEVEAPLGRRLLAEFVGTLLFVATGCGAATVLALGPLRELAKVTESAGGNLGPNEQFIRSLLSADIGGTLAVALAFAFSLAILVYALGGVSGAHFNPAVTFGLAVSRRFPWKEVGPYWVVQLIGGIGGAFVIAGIYGRGDISGADVLFGATTVADGVNQAQALLSEAFITFLLVTAVMAVAVDPRAPKGFSGIGIGLALAAGIIVTAAATGGSANFARSLGPFVASIFYDTPKIPWDDLIIYAAGPFIGAAAAALVYESVTGLELIAPAPRPGAATASTDESHSHDAGESHVHSHGSELHSHPHDHADGPDHDHDHDH